jgi:hypothetical protein
MIDIHGQFQLSYFADFSDVEASAETISALAKEFAARRLVPTTFQEIGPFGSRLRIRLVTADNEWAIDVESGRIEVEKNATTPRGENLGPLEEFCRDGSEIVRGLLKIANRKGNRLALVTKGLLAEMSPSVLQETYLRLFNPPQFFRESPPRSWFWRSVGRAPVNIRAMDETINVILTASRTPRQLAFDPSRPTVDRVEVEFDINTFQGNKDTRFDSESLAEFLPIAIEHRGRVLQQVEEHLNG